MKTRTVRLGDVADFLTGFPFKSREYSKDGSGIRLLRGDNIGQGFLRWDGAKLWPHHSTRDYEKFELKLGDVVLAMDRPWIEAGLKYSVVNKADLPALLVQRVARLRGTESLDTGYLRYLIGSQEFTKHVHTVSTGTAVPHISGRDILAFEFELPEMEVQKEIARTLGTLDDKIELNRRLSATLEEMARALYRSWFVDFDPVHARALGQPPAHMDPTTAAFFPDSFGPDGLPKGWKSVPLLELMDLISGGTPKTSEPSYWDGEIPWASAKDVSQCGKAFLTATERSITEQGLKKSSTKIVPKYATVVVARGATTGRSCMFGSDIAMNQTCYALKSKRNEPFFANCLFMQQVLNITQAAHGSVFDTITTKTLQAAEAIVPTAELSQAFESRVSPLFQLVLSRTVENERLAALRDTLLPRLMSGELRIREAEKQVEETV